MKDEYKKYIEQGRSIHSDIEAHNSACKGSLEIINEIIQAQDLIVSENADVSDSRAPPERFSIFESLDGTNM